MERKKFLVQVFAAVILYTVISLILENDVSQQTVFKELLEGVVFGVFYGIFIWLSAKWRKKK